MKLNNILKIALIAPFLVACGENDEFDGNAGGVATFSATIEGVSTRATDTSWAANDSIGISVDSENSATEGSNVKYITADGDGTFAAASAKIAFGDKNKVNFRAYYPYTAASNINSNGNISVSTVIANQGAAIDYMYATGNGSSTKPNVKLSFSHKMSQVVLNFIAGNGITDFSGSNLKFTLSGIVQSGTFNTTTGVATATSGAKAEDITVTPASTAYISDNKTVSQSLIFLPQTLETLDLELTVGETTYAATLSLPTVDDEQGLLAGRSVSYDITVNKSSLNASNCTIVGWTKDEGSFASGKLGTHFAEDAQLYDLAFSDGSFISVFNTENNTVDISGLTDTQRENVVGIVYWIGDPAKDDGLLQADYPDCNHGLILALKDMTDGKVKWQGSEYAEYSVFSQFSSIDSKFLPNKYDSSIIQYNDFDTTHNTTQLNKALGYNNTRLLRAYNYYYSDKAYKVLPIEYLDLFVADNKAPEGSSGWFLPSPKELVLLVRSDNNICFFDYTESVDHTKFNKIMYIIKSIGATVVDEGTSRWTSSECNNTYLSQYKSLCVYFGNLFSSNKTFGGVRIEEKNSEYNLRAVCAF